MRDAGEEITDPRLKRIAANQVCPVHVRALVMALCWLMLFACLVVERTELI